MTNNKESEKHSDMHFILDMNLLNSGDIILEHGYAKHSKIISKQTNSHYSHAMIYTNGTIIEATQEGGVFTRVPNRFTVKNIKDLKVLRLKSSPKKETLDHICNYATSLCGSQYSIIEALKVKSPKFTKKSTNNDRKQFCSRLVAQCYQKGGINLVNDINFCSPGDIERSPLLEEVIGAVRPASEKEISHAQSEIPHTLHVQNSVKFVKAALDIFKTYGITTIGSEEEEIVIATLSDILTAAYMYSGKKEYPHLDEKIANALHSSGYLDHINMDRQQNPHRFDLMLFKEKIKPNSCNHLNSIVLSHLEDEIKINQRELRHLDEYTEFRELLQISNFKFIEAYIKIPKALLEQTLERVYIIKYYSSDYRLTYIENKCEKIIEKIIKFAPELKKSSIDQS